MKVIINWKRTSIALHVSAFSEGYKNVLQTNVNFSWGFLLWKQISFFQHDNQSYFLLRFAG